MNKKDKDLKMKDIFNKYKVFVAGIALVIGLGLICFMVIRVFYMNRENKKPGCNKCNVVIIDVDILRADAIDCKNNYDRTPNICSVIKESVNFRNNISQSDLTVVDQVSTFTSLYPTSHGFWAKDISNYPSFTTSLPAYLKTHNFSTAVTEMEKIYSEYNDKEWFNWFEKGINYDSLQDWFNNSKTAQKNFFLYVFTWKLHAPYLQVKDDILNEGGYIPDNFPLDQNDFNELLSDYLVKNYKDVFQEKTIKEYPNIFSGDMEKNKKSILALYNRFEILGNRRAMFLKDSWIPKYNTYFSMLNPDKPEDLKFIKNVYLKTLSKIDGELSALLRTLNEPEYKNNTILIIKSDHGEEFYEHKKFSHANNLYQELIRTPLVIRIPGVKPSEVNRMSENIDIMPTIFDLLGIPIPQQVQGVSLLPLLANPKATIRDYQIAQKGEYDYVSAFIKGDWKLIMRDGREYQLYNLAKDPGEKNSVIESEKEISLNLFNEYNRIIQKLPVYGQQSAPLPTWVDEQKRQRLKDEGYF